MKNQALSMLSFPFIPAVPASRFRGLVPVFIFGLLCGGCKKAEESEGGIEAVSATPSVAAEAVPEEFMPPAHGLLKPEQLHRFLLVHEALIQVNELFLDSLAGVAPAQKRSLLNAIDLSREKVARKFGLSGFAEYRWILEEAPKKPANLRLFDQMKISIVGPARSGSTE